MNWLRLRDFLMSLAVSAGRGALTLSAAFALLLPPDAARANLTCEAYADFAVEQFRSKSLLRCEGGLREWWSGNYVYHHGWCASLPAGSDLPEKGIADRAAVLSRCESLDTAQHGAPPAPPAQPNAVAAACESIPGLWAWFVNGDATIQRGGTVTQGNLTGRWTCNESGDITIVWSHGYTDRLALSADGQRLTGTNNRNEAVTAERKFSAGPRLAQPPAQAAPQAAQMPPRERDGSWSKYEATVTLRPLADNPSRGVLGVRIASTETTLEPLQAGTKTGVLVLSINQNSASEGLLQRGDIIVAASGRATHSPAGLASAISRFTPGMPVMLEFWRYAGGFPQLQAALYARAQANDPSATYVLGYFEQNPASGEPNHARAFAFFLRAAALNHLDAIEAIARAYRDGRGVEKNSLEAAKWFRRAADAGLPAAMYNLANLVVDGQVGPADPVEAFRLMQRAAASGYAMAHYRLASYFDFGRGTIRDPQAGARHLLAAARAAPDMPHFVGSDLAKWNPSSELIMALQQQLSEAGLYQGPRDGKLSPDLTAALARLPPGTAR
jgi:hypothetical protein